MNQAAPVWGPRFAELYPELVRLGDLAAAVTATDAVLSHCDFFHACAVAGNDRFVVPMLDRSMTLAALRSLLTYLN